MDIIISIIKVIFNDVKRFRNFCNNDPIEVYLTISNYNYCKLIKKVVITVCLVIIYIYLKGWF